LFTQEEQGECSKRGEGINVIEAVREFDLAFWMYAAFGMLLYGAMVPFWFVGAKYLQFSSGMSVATSDALMLLPEGVMVLVALPLGMGLDRCGHDLPRGAVTIRVDFEGTDTMRIKFCRGDVSRQIRNSSLVCMMNKEAQSSQGTDPCVSERSSKSKR
jgi:hypothetical protein